MGIKSSGRDREMRCHSSAPRAHTGEEGAITYLITATTCHLQTLTAHAPAHTVGPSMCTSRTSRQQAQPPAPPHNLGRKAAAVNVRPYAHNSHESPGQRTQHKPYTSHRVTRSPHSSKHASGSHVPTQKKLSLQHVAHTTRRCTMSPCT